MSASAPGQGRLGLLRYFGASGELFYFPLFGHTAP